MSKKQKLIDRLSSIPKDFTWDELVCVLDGYGYELQKSKGSSRRAFLNKYNKHTFYFHKPHPSNLVKRYILDEVIKTLKDQGAMI
jgi:HicA toxin of bacterial toxin-antitoxin,